MTISIRALEEGDLPLFNAHFSRHAAESGRGDVHFMPYDPDHAQQPLGLNPAALERALDEPGWQRWFAAFTPIEGSGDGRSETDEQIVGHLDLQGSRLMSGLHRCELGIGIEKACRGQGLGRDLMQVGIDFARRQPMLDWLDLRVFSHNTRALALYRAMGFIEAGITTDLFRIGGDSIDDVLMTLDVRTAAPAQDAGEALRIRPYLEADEEQVIALWQDCGLVVPQNNAARDIARKLQVNRELFLVGCDESGVVATVMGGYEGHRGWINYLAVQPRLQHKGYGRMLMTEIERRLIDRGCPKINLQVRSGNAGVIAFYESIGYRPDDVVGLGKRLEPDQ
jgi:ribosomal protein S18 acetylase RimI-like enzyme